MVTTVHGERYPSGSLLNGGIDMAEKYSVRLEEYDKARKLAQRQYRTSIVAGAYPYLPALDDLLPYVDIVSENDLGTVEVPLDMIVGTKTAGRQSAFASNFMPLLWRKVDGSLQCPIGGGDPGSDQSI